MNAYLFIALFAIAPLAIGQTFIPAGSVPSPGSFNSAVRLLDGRVLFVGGGASAVIYDPSTGVFAAITGRTTQAVDTTARLRDGRVLIVGGDATAELFDPFTDAFTRVSDLIAPQIAATAVLLKNGKVLIAGGLESACCPTRAVNAEIFDPASDTFSLTGPYQSEGDYVVSGGPFASAVVALADGRVLVAGEPNSEIYDPDTNAFTLTGSMITPCVLGGNPGYIAGRTATLLKDGQVLLTGGAHEDCGRFADAELFDPVTGAFSRTAPMSRARDNHRATLLADGKVLITGGETEGCDDFSCLFSGTTSSAELYDPLTGTFTSAGNMLAPRAGHTATLLGNGDVLLVGGYAYYGIGSEFCCFDQAEIYAPAPSPRKHRVVR